MQFTTFVEYIRNWLRVWPEGDKMIEINNSMITTVVTINATLIGILLAFLSAYTVYFKSLQNEQTIDLINEAGRINTITFFRSCYFSPSLSPKIGHDWGDTINYDINKLREELDIKRAEEPKTRQLSPPQDINDIEKLDHYLRFLNNPPWENDNFVKNLDLPRDPANRGEEIMRVLNMFSMCYLFPEPPFESERNFLMRERKKIYFNNVEDIKLWLKGLEQFVYGIRSQKFLLILENSQDEYIKALKSRDQRLIEKWESHPYFRSRGFLDPVKIKEDYFKNFAIIEGIADSTRYMLNKVENLKSNILSSKTVVIFLVALLVLFAIGVYAPLACPRVPKFLYFHISFLSHIILWVWVIKSIRLFSS